MEIPTYMCYYSALPDWKCSLKLDGKWMYVEMDTDKVIRMGLEK